MLTIGSKPELLVRKHTEMYHMLLWSLRQQIEEKYTKGPFDKIRREQVGFIGFRREEWNEVYDNIKPLPWLGILIYAPSNYISIYKKIGPSDGFIEHKFNWENWEFVTSHDSCWYDALQRIVLEHEETITSFAWLPAVRTFKIESPQVEILKTVRKQEEDRRWGR